MQTNPTNPPAPPAVGILNPITSLLATAPLYVSPPSASNIIETNPSTSCLQLPLGAGLPPLPHLLLADRLAKLYEMVFPDRPEWLMEETVQWRDEEGVATAIQRFLQRVSTLFPVHDDIWDVDLEAVEWRLHEIPVIPMGVDEWYDGWDDYKEPIPYLLHLQYSRGNKHSPNEFADLYPAHQLPRNLESHRLVETLRETCAECSRSMNLPEPLYALPDLILMLDHATDNAWLDVGEMALADGGGYPLWQPEEVAWLTEEWQKAQPILNRINRLLDWQDDTPEAIDKKITAVRDMLLEAHHREQQLGETAVSP